jgi:hypothetical protein
MRSRSIGTVGDQASQFARAGIEACDDALAGGNHIEMVGGAHLLAALDAHADAGIIQRALLGQKGAMPGIGLGCRQPTRAFTGPIASNSAKRVRMMRAPTPDNAPSALSNAALTVASSPSSMKFSGTARRSPVRFAGAGPNGDGVSPARIASISAQHATLGASGPTESRLGARGSTPVIGTRRAVGL